MSFSLCNIDFSCRIYNCISQVNLTDIQQESFVSDHFCFRNQLWKLILQNNGKRGVGLFLALERPDAEYFQVHAVFSVIREGMPTYSKYRHEAFVFGRDKLRVRGLHNFMDQKTTQRYLTIERVEKAKESNLIVTVQLTEPSKFSVSSPDINSPWLKANPITPRNGQDALDTTEKAISSHRSFLGPKLTKDPPPTSRSDIASPSFGSGFSGGENEYTSSSTQGTTMRMTPSTMTTSSSLEQTTPTPTPIQTPTTTMDLRPYSSSSSSSSAAITRNSEKSPARYNDVRKADGLNLNSEYLRTHGNSRLIDL